MRSLVDGAAKSPSHQTWFRIALVLKEEHLQVRRINSTEADIVQKTQVQDCPKVHLPGRLYQTRLYSVHKLVRRMVTKWLVWKYFSLILLLHTQSCFSGVLPFPAVFIPGFFFFCPLPTTPVLFPPPTTTNPSVAVAAPLLTSCPFNVDRLAQTSSAAFWVVLKRAQRYVYVTLPSPSLAHLLQTKLFIILLQHQISVEWRVTVLCGWAKCVFVSLKNRFGPCSLRDGNVMNYWKDLIQSDVLPASVIWKL